MLQPSFVIGFSHLYTLTINIMSKLLFTKELVEALTQSIGLLSECIDYQSLQPEYKAKYDEAIEIINNACTKGEIELLLNTINY